MSAIEPTPPHSHSGSITERASAGGMVGTDRRELALRRQGETEELLHDAEYQLQSVCYPQFLVYSLNVGVDRSRFDAEPGGDGGFLDVVERGATTCNSRWVS